MLHLQATNPRTVSLEHIFFPKEIISVTEKMLKERLVPSRRTPETRNGPKGTIRKKKESRGDLKQSRFRKESSGREDPEKPEHLK